MTAHRAAAAASANTAAERAGAAPAPAQGGAAGKRRVPWRGRKRADDAKDKIIPCGDRRSTRADRTGGEPGGAEDRRLCARTMALGTPGPRAVKRPPVENARAGAVAWRDRQARLERQPDRQGVEHGQERGRASPSWPQMRGRHRGDARATLMKALAEAGVIIKGKSCVGRGAARGAHQAHRHQRARGGQGGARRRRPRTCAARSARWRRWRPARRLPRAVLSRLDQHARRRALDRRSSGSRRSTGLRRSWA